jgi:hypothetical protein
MQVSMKRWSWVAAVAGLAMQANSAKAVFYTEQYEMNASPTTLAGTANGNTLSIADPTGNGTYGPEGWVYSGGIGTFLDDSNSSGNQGLAVTGTWMNGSVSYTADYKIQVLGNQAGSGGKKSLSFWTGGVGRGLQLNTNTAVFVSGSGTTGTSWGLDLSSLYRDVRVIVDGTAFTATMYWDENDNDINDGDYTHANVTTGLGGSGFWGGTTVGFALGSTGGSSTTFSNYNMDYFRVFSGGTNPNAIYEVVPEPATLALLALGAVPMMMRRRRAA